MPWVIAIIDLISGYDIVTRMCWPREWLLALILGLLTEFAENFNKVDPGPTSRIIFPKELLISISKLDFALDCV